MYTQGAIRSLYGCQNVTFESMLRLVLTFLGPSGAKKIDYGKFIRCLVSRILSKICQRSNFPNSFDRVEFSKCSDFIENGLELLSLVY